jgi:hypothetical protein
MWKNATLKSAPAANTTKSRSNFSRINGLNNSVKLPTSAIELINKPLTIIQFSVVIKRLLHSAVAG